MNELPNTIGILFSSVDSPKPDWGYSSSSRQCPRPRPRVQTQETASPFREAPLNSLHWGERGQPEQSTSKFGFGNTHKQMFTRISPLRPSSRAYPSSTDFQTLLHLLHKRLAPGQPSRVGTPPKLPTCPAISPDAYDDTSCDIDSVLCYALSETSEKPSGIPKGTWAV